MFFSHKQNENVDYFADILASWVICPDIDECMCLRIEIRRAVVTQQFERTMIKSVLLENRFIRSAT